MEHINYVITFSHLGATRGSGHPPKQLRTSSKWQRSKAPKPQSNDRALKQATLY